MPPTDAEGIEWRDVVGFEGRYEVSNYGHVRTIPHYVDNHTGRILLKAQLLRPNVLRKGYLQVTISDGDSRCPCHRLQVAVIRQCRAQYPSEQAALQVVQRASV